MACAAVRFEVGKPDLRMLGLQTDVQCCAVKRGGHPEPVFVIVRRDGLVTVPGFVVGRLAGVAQLEMVSLAGCQAVNLEVEPLKVRAFGIRFDCQLNLQRIAGVQYLDIATVEVTADMK